MPIDSSSPVYLGNFHVFFMGFSLTPPGGDYLTGIVGSMDMTANPTSGFTFNELLNDRLDYISYDELNSREITVLMEERTDIANYYGLKSLYADYETINNNYSLFYYITDDSTSDTIVYAAEFYGFTMKQNNYRDPYITNDKHMTNTKLVSGFTGVFGNIRFNDETARITQVIGSGDYDVIDICDAYQTQIVNP